MNSSDNKTQKVSIRFFNDREVRAVWDETLSKWWYSVLDVVGVLNDQDDYTKNRNYWKYLKTKLKKEGNELVSVTNQLKLLAPDGKRRLTDIPWRCIGRFRGHGPDFLAEIASDCPDF